MKVIKFTGNLLRPIENRLITKFNGKKLLFQSNHIDKALSIYEITNKEVVISIKECLIDDVTTVSSVDTKLLGQIHDDLLENGIVNESIE